MTCSILGSARVSRAGFGVTPNRTLLSISFITGENGMLREVRDREDALASTRDACATQTLRSNKRFGDGIGDESTFLSQDKVRVQLLKQAERDKLLCLAREIFEFRGRNALARAQRKRDAFCAFHFRC